MRSYLTRLITTTVMLLALLAPFASGWAMTLGMAEGRVLVICTGDGLRTIYVDHDGTPTELSSTAEVCVLKSAADTARPVFLIPPAKQVLYVKQPARRVAPPVSTGFQLARLPRAPPMI